MAAGGGFVLGTGGRFVCFSWTVAPLTGLPSVLEPSFVPLITLIFRGGCTTFTVAGPEAGTSNSGASTAPTASGASEPQLPAKAEYCFAAGNGKIVLGDAIAVL